MNTIFLLPFLLFPILLPAQSIGLRAGHSFLPADHFSLRYEHWTNSGINLAGTVFYEQNKAKSLSYRCIGIDLLGEYESNREDPMSSLFGYRIGLGCTIQHVQEPWLYKYNSFLQRLNYGLAGEASIQCYLTEYFRLDFFFQQKFFFRSRDGSPRFAFGAGLHYRFSGL